MTLRIQLNAVILSVLVLSFIGSVSINLLNTQHFLSGQLASHAQDTATSLGLSLSDPIFNEETVVVEATINAIFDRGFYHHIRLESVNGSIEYQRISETQPEQVPQWFIDLFPLNAPEQKTMIDTGWTIGGVLKVQSHTGLAYAQLWKSANEITHATLFIFLLALLFAYIMLQQMYKPIKAISLQAEAIQQRRFILIEKLPVAAELRSFVLAMNKMVANIKNTYEELTEAATEIHRTVYIDEKTGTENRRAFIDMMDSLLAESAKHNGCIMMARIIGLTKLNKNQGYQAGDNLVNQLVNVIQQETEQDVKLYRISGSEFCLLTEEFQTPKLIQFINSVIKKLNVSMESTKEVNIAFGFVNFKSSQQFANVMYELDMATNNASENSDNFYIQQQSNKIEQFASATNLKKVLDKILEEPEKYITLRKQDTLCCSQRLAFDSEMFASFEYNNNTINTGDLFAIASQYGETGKLDFTIIKLILERCKLNQFEDQLIALNLSRLTFSDSVYMKNITQLIKESGYGKSLVIGLTESSILGDMNESKLKIEALTLNGCSICINRFGSSIESLQYMMEIRPALVKLSPAFTRNIDVKKNNEQMVSAFVRMAHGLDITVMAQCVETKNELAILQGLKIDAALGYVINKPCKLK